MSKYNSLSKKESVSLLEEKDRKKEYGLFWDDEKESEKVVVEHRDNLSVLKMFESKKIRNDEDDDLGDNILIEKDNYQIKTFNYVDLFCGAGGFSLEGNILFSKRISSDVMEFWKDYKLENNILNKKRKEYLKYHRELMMKRQ